MAKNGTIAQTKWTEIKRGSKVVPNYLNELSNAITKLEKYGVNVDNCGVANCCQSCQGCQACQGCQSQSCQGCQSCQSCQKLSECKHNCNCNCHDDH